jgi:hypothetical protein
MKKSKLLSLLKQDIKDADGNLDLQASMVLARCLSVGMLPPATYMTNMPKVEGNRVVLAWDNEDDEDVPYGKSVVEEVNAEIKRLNKIIDFFENPE